MTDKNPTNDFGFWKRQNLNEMAWKIKLILKTMEMCVEIESGDFYSRLLESSLLQNVVHRRFDINFTERMA